MNIYAINGSPRKNRNTATLLQHALEGAQSAAPDQVETTMIHLYDLHFQPCISCFACKRLGGSSYGKCAVKDELTPVLEMLAQADGIIFGSPIYLSSITAKLRGFLERFLFQYSVYDRNYSSLAPKKMPVAFIYTMNLDQERMIELKYPELLHTTEFFVEKMFSKPQVLHAYNTYQFDDYSKYKMEVFSEAEKAAYRDAHFPEDCRKAHGLGAAMVKGK